MVRFARVVAPNEFDECLNFGIHYQKPTGAGWRALTVGGPGLVLRPGFSWVLAGPQEPDSSHNKSIQFRHSVYESFGHMYVGCRPPGSSLPITILRNPCNRLM